MTGATGSLAFSGQLESVEEFMEDHISPKAINVVWRALSKCLRTRSEQVLKHVPVQILCPVCFGDAETVMHSLVSCPFAQQCWSILLYHRSGISILNLCHGWRTSGNQQTQNKKRNL